MRAALEQIERIEKYLLNEMSSADKLAFESEISANPTLKSQVEIQQQLVTGIQRIGLKASAQKARIKYNIRKWSIRIAVTISVVLAGLAAAYFISKGEGNCAECGYETNKVESFDMIGHENCCPEEEAEISPNEIIEYEEEVHQENHLDTLTDGFIAPSINSNKAEKSIVEYEELQESANFVVTNIKNKVAEKINPTFPGGEVALSDWLMDNTIYPEALLNIELNEHVTVEFEVSSTGKVQNEKIKTGKNSILNESALATIRKMPDWKPARVNNIAVESKYVVPIYYRNQAISE